jgi:hypothetical protein
VPSNMRIFAMRCRSASTLTVIVGWCCRCWLLVVGRWLLLLLVVGCWLLLLLLVVGCWLLVAVGRWLLSWSVVVVGVVVVVGGCWRCRRCGRKNIGQKLTCTSAVRQHGGTGNGGGWQCLSVLWEAKDTTISGGAQKKHDAS